MMKNDFSHVAATPENPLYAEFIRRGDNLYSEKGEIRSPFARDYTCTALHGISQIKA